MSIRQQIPDPSGVKDPQAASVLKAVKAAVEEITGRAPNTQLIKTLGTDANIYAVVNTVNDVVNRLQDPGKPLAKIPASGLKTVSIASSATVVLTSGTVAYATAAGTAALAGTSVYADTASFSTSAAVASTATFAETIGLQALLATQVFGA